MSRSRSREAMTAAMVSVLFSETVARSSASPSSSSFTRASSPRFSSHFVARRLASERLGFEAFRMSLSNSPTTRSLASSVKRGASSRASSIVSEASSKPKRPAICTPRSTRRGSSEKASVVWRSTRDSRSASPPYSSTSSPRTGEYMRALMVKSRRPAASR